MKIFDTHAHYDDEAFTEDMDNLLCDMHKKGVKRIVNIGCSMESSRFIVDMVDRYGYVYGAVGVHPDDVGNLTDADMRELAELSKQDKILAIGEIGLDYHCDDIDKESQKRWFVEQLGVAKQERLPVVIHSRDAAKDTLDIMRAAHAGDMGGVIHCFSYTKEIAREYLDLDFYFGIGGVVTFQNGKKLKEAVEYIPIEKILLETDSPYLAPVPYRGQRNSSLNIPLIAKEISVIKKLDYDEVIKITEENAKNLFRIKKDI